MVWCTVVPVICLVVSVAGLVGNLWPVWVVGFMAFLACVFVPMKMLMNNWPSSMVIDSDGISIGATGRRARRVVAPTTQAQGQFRVEWYDVSRVDVLTTKAELAPIWKLRNAAAGIKPANLRRGPYSAGTGFSFVEGLLPVWGMRAAVLINLRDSDVGQRPSYRSVRGQAHVPRAVWAVPTRHADAVRDALARAGHRATLCPGMAGCRRLIDGPSTGGSALFSSRRTPEPPCAVWTIPQARHQSRYRSRVEIIDVRHRQDRRQAVQGRRG